MGAMGNRGEVLGGLLQGCGMATVWLWGTGGWGIWGPTVGLEGADPQLHHGAVVQDLGGNMEVREE